MADDRKPSTKPPELLDLKALGKYHIHKRLGAGGMGAVFLATDTDLKRAVALKVLPKDRAENPILVRRFRSEAQAVAHLKHDNIVSIYEAGEIDGFPYLALEYVEGTDLLTLVQKRGVVPPKRSLKIIRQVADALRHAHERGIVHRDIKPSNVLVKTDGTVKLTDLGLARSVDETLDTSITRAGTTVGTIDYIAPEQACDSKAADIRSDIYALGCTWYHLLTGSPPFPDGDMKNKLHAHLHAPPPDPRYQNSNVPEAYVAVMQQMMAKRPQDRYQEPAELLADLDKVAGAVNHFHSEMFDESDSGDEGRAATAAGGGSRASGPREPGDIELGEPSQKMKVKKRKEEADSKRPPRDKPGRSGRAKADADDLEDGEVVDASGAAKKSRKLPERQRNQSPGGFSINVDVARIAIAGVIVAGILGAVWWVMREGGGFGSAGGSSTDRPPVDQAPQPVDPHAAEPQQVAQPGAANPRPTRVDPSQERYVLTGDPPRVDRTIDPFPGIEDILDVNSAIAKDWVPDWVYGLRQAPTEGLQLVELSPANDGGTSFAQAIGRLKGRSGIIELKGNGAFPLSPQLITETDRLLIRAARGSQPLIVLTGGLPADAARGHLQLMEGVLELRGVHLLTQTPLTAPGQSLLGVGGGTLVLRECSVTVTPEAGAVAVCDVRPGRDAAVAPRVLIEDCLFRGEGLSAVQATGTLADVVIGGSALVSSQGTLVHLDVPVIPPRPVADESSAGTVVSSDAEPAPAAPVKPACVRVVGSLLVTGGDAFQLARPAEAGASPTSVRLRRSQISGLQDAAVLMTLANWPAPEVPATPQTQVADLDCRIDQVVLTGWRSLVHLERAGATADASDAAGWQQFWGVPLESSALPTVTTPLDVTVPSVLSLADAIDLLVSTNQAPDGQPVLAGAAQPPQSAIDRLFVLNDRPRLPDDLRDIAADRPVLALDLRDRGEKLNDILNSAEVPDRAVVRASGVGLIELPPLHIRNKTIALEFVQAGEGAPLTLRPGSGGNLEASIIVEGGRLDLIGARLQASPSRSAATPARLILVKSGQLTLRHSQIQGTMSGEPPDTPLIDWPAGEASRDRDVVYITNTHIVAQQPLLAAVIDQRLLVLDNNVLASAGDCVHLSSQVGAREIERTAEGWAIIEHCTLLTGRNAVKLAGLSTGRTRPAAHVLSRANVFAVSPGAIREEISLSAHAPQMTRDNLFDWWEARNGYAPQIARFRNTSGEPGGAAQTFLQGWVGFWGDDHVQQAVTGPSGVLFATVLTSLAGLEPRHVAINNACNAARAAEDGGPIGARVENVGPAGGVAAQPAGSGARSSGQPEF